MSSSFVRFSMKYSSTSSVAVSGERSRCDVMGGLELAGRSGRPAGGARGPRRILRAGEQLDTPDHSVPVDFVHVERLADAAEQHDRQLAAQVLAELLEPAENAAVPPRGFSRCSRELRRAAGRSPTATSRSRMRRQSRSGKEAAQVAHSCCRARCRSPPPRRGAAGGPVSLLELVRRPVPEVERPRGPELERDRRRSRCARGAALPNGGSAAPSLARHAPTSVAASRFEQIEERRVPDERHLDRLGDARPPVAIGQGRAGTPKSLITANGGAKRAEIVLLAERVDAVLDADRGVVLRQHGRRHCESAGRRDAPSPRRSRRRREPRRRRWPPRRNGGTGARRVWPQGPARARAGLFFASSPPLDHQWRTSGLESASVARGSGVRWRSGDPAGLRRRRGR